MEPIPVSPVAYASPRSADETPRASLRATVAAAWLLTILAVIESAFERFELSQAQAGYVGRYVFRFGSLDAMDRVVRWAVEPVVLAGLFGMFAAAALWHWPRHRLPWAAAVPAAAAAWLFFNPLMSAGPSIPMSTSFPPTLIVTAIQCAGVYAGTRCGRPVARWLAGHLLPPSMSGPLVALWAHD